METTRPPGFPGNPPARMPRAPTPAKSPPPRPLSSDDVAFRPTQDVGPRNQCISGLNHAAYRAPCERFAPWVTPGPRITRFRLAADLGRMGLDAHRVSNKVSKITSRHLVPLNRAFPGTRVGARIVTGPHDANRRDPHMPMRYDTGRPRAVIRFRISQPRTTSLPCLAGLRARRPSPMMDLSRKNAFSTRP